MSWQGAGDDEPKHDGDEGTVESSGGRARTVVQELWAQAEAEREAAAAAARFAAEAARAAARGKRFGRRSQPAPLVPFAPQVGPAPLAPPAPQIGPAPLVPPAPPFGHLPPGGAESPDWPLERLVELRSGPQPGRRVGLAAVAAGAVIMVAAGIAALFVLGSKGPSWPKQWDPRIASVVAFDESHRNLRFAHPVAVVFLTDQAFRTKVEGGTQPITAGDRADANTLLGALRALGLTSGSPDLISGSQNLQGSTIDGFYDPKAKKIWVRGDVVTPHLRVVLAHELTHVLQDQNFGLRPRNGDDASVAYTAVVEADAMRIQNLYLASMSPDDQASFHKTEDEMQTVAQPAEQNVPPALVDAEQFPYVIGPQFLDALTATAGVGAIDDALRDPPKSTSQIIEPGRFLAHDVVVKVPPPALGKGERLLQPASTGGALQLFEILYDRLHVTAAWAGARSWAGDSSIEYSSQGRTCVRLDLATVGDPHTLFLALQIWAKQGGNVTMVGPNVRLDVCDPGPQAKAIPAPAIGVLDVLALRGQLAQGIASAAQMSQSRVDCVTDAVLQVADSGGLQHVIDLAGRNDSTALRNYSTDLGVRARKLIADACPAS